jgi:predicted Rossmann fold nucleotide-binding protein DprA/Smf involved in DNA uptake
MANDDLTALLQEREDAQAAITDATDEIEGLTRKLREAEKALESVNSRIAAALGIESKPSKASAGRTNHERVLEVLKNADGPMPRKAIAAELDAEPNSVGSALAYLKKQGKAKQEGVKAAAVWTAA